jgi:hypothetical protein
MRAMRIGFIALTLAAPSLAAAAASTDDEMAAALPKQQEIDQAADTLDRLVGALLDVRIGPLAEAIDPERRADPRRRDETLRDMARRDDPYFEQRMRGSIATMRDNAGAMMARLAALAPLLRETMAEFERQVGEATRDLPEDHDD